MSTGRFSLSATRLNLIRLIVFTLTLPIAVVFSTELARRSFERVKLGGQTVTVKGYAEHPIISDRAMWSARISVNNLDRTQAYMKLEEDRGELLTYLSDRGFSPEFINLGPVSIKEVEMRDREGNYTNQTDYYILSQRFTIASNKVEDISNIARDASSLIAQGIGLHSESPTYLYTKLNDLKLTMITQATANARQRASLLVTGSGNTLGSLRSASQGVFQITPAFSTVVSSSGYHDTSSVRKVIKAVITAEYEVGL